MILKCYSFHLANHFYTHELLILFFIRTYDLFTQTEIWNYMSLDCQKHEKSSKYICLYSQISDKIFY